MGLREDKKAATRRRISDVATALFLRRSFAEVTVAEVAEAAGVSKMTVFNYFATKEDLLLDRQQENIDELCGIIRQRAEGVPVAEALRAVLVRRLAERHAMAGVNAGVGPFWSLVRADRDLTNRALQQNLELTRAIGDALAEEFADRWLAHAAARLIVATLDTVFTTAIDKHIAGVPAEQVAAEQEGVIDDAFDLLGQGLGRFGADRP